MRITMDQGRLGRRGVRAMLLSLWTVLLIQLFAAINLAPLLPAWPGHDFMVYRDATARWLATGEFYPALQLAGPYPVVSNEILYPPVALLLFAPFTVLPAVLWVVIPTGFLAWMVFRAKPSPTRWAVILLLMTLPILSPVSWTVELAIDGNPILWVAMIVGLATRYPVFGPFALLKPAPLLIPFAAIGIRSRSWWFGLAVLAGLSALFLPMWFDYLTVVQNSRGLGAIYAVSSVPMLLIPVVARRGLAARDPARSDP